MRNELFLERNAAELRENAIIAITYGFTLLAFICHPILTSNSLIKYGTIKYKIYKLTIKGVPLTNEIKNFVN